MMGTVRGRQDQRYGASRSDLLQLPASGADSQMTNLRPDKMWPAVLMISILISSCSNVNQSAKPARKLTSCPPGEYLVCESRQPPSKGGAEEEIPEYEYCRCQ